MKLKDKKDQQKYEAYQQINRGYANNFCWNQFKNMLIAKTDTDVLVFGTNVNKMKYYKHF